MTGVHRVRDISRIDASLRLSADEKLALKIVEVGGGHGTFVVKSVAGEYLFTDGTFDCTESLANVAADIADKTFTRLEDLALQCALDDLRPGEDSVNG